MSRSRQSNQTLLCHNPSCPAPPGKLFKDLKGINHHFARSPACTQYFELQQQQKSPIGAPQFDVPFNSSLQQPPSTDSTLLSDSPSQADNDDDVPFPDSHEWEDEFLIPPNLDLDPTNSLSDVNNGEDEPTLRDVLDRPPNIYDPSIGNNSISFRQWVSDWNRWLKKKKATRICWNHAILTW